MLDLMRRRCVAFFLCGFDPGSGRRRTRDVARELLLQSFSEELVAEFLDVQLSTLQAELVEEVSTRYASGLPLRFQIVDSAGVGSKVSGNSDKKSKANIAFQEVLHALSPDEFEDLAAVVLKILGCSEVFATPRSHDQGVDAFGYQNVIADVPHGVVHHLTWIAQAKHYKSQAVSTNEIRELVGTKELLLAKAFSTIDKKYSELRLLNYAPTAIVLITTEEIPATVRRLAKNSGAFVLAASDLRHLLTPLIPRASIASLKKYLADQMKHIPSLN
jgi:HJR/Mrr/RecB family endonuclease